MLFVIKIKKKIQLEIQIDNWNRIYIRQQQRPLKFRKLITKLGQNIKHKNTMSST